MALPWTPGTNAPVPRYQSPMPRPPSGASHAVPSTLLVPPWELMAIGPALEVHCTLPWPSDPSSPASGYWTTKSLTWIWG
jgi:hypothetical protein